MARSLGGPHFWKLGKEFFQGEARARGKERRLTEQRVSFAGQPPSPQTSSPLVSALQGCGCLFWVCGPVGNQACEDNQVLKNLGTA